MSQAWQFRADSAHGSQTSLGHGRRAAWQESLQGFGLLLTGYSNLSRDEVEKAELDFLSSVIRLELFCFCCVVQSCLGFENLLNATWE